jgi:heat shock protein HslJ
MKKHSFFAILCIICGFWGCNSNKGTVNSNAVDNVHNSRNSLNWDNLYFGTTSCADCSGIDIQLQLNSDLTYKMSISYQDKPGTILYSGKFTWNTAGSQIDLNGIKEGGAFEHYRVQENRLLLLTPQGEIVSGANADLYLLNKVETNPLNSDITNKYWKLVELNGKPINYSKDVAKEAYIIFKPDGKVHGSLSCNTLIGTYTLEEGNRIHFSEMVSTKKMCMDMSVEDELSKIFQIADNYNLTENKLVLNRARMAPLARFEVVYLR